MSSLALLTVKSSSEIDMQVFMAMPVQTPSAASKCLFEKSASIDVSSLSTSSAL